jgi:hypothetical protein
VISTPFGKRGLFWDQYRLATDQQGVNSDVKVYGLYPSTINPLISEEDMERERLNLKSASTKLTHTWQGFRWTWGLQDEIVIYEESDVIE